MGKTWGEIKRQCIALLDEKMAAYSKAPSTFIDAANYALNFIALRVRPIADKVAVSQRGPVNILTNPHPADIAKYSGTPLVYSASGARAYYFECDGDGEAAVASDGVIAPIALHSDGGFKQYRGFASGEVSITFGGEFSYCVRNVAVYGEIYSADPKDIQAFSEYLAYDLDELTKIGGRSVFLDFSAELPIKKANSSDGDGYCEVTDFKKEKGHILLLKSSEVGEFDIWYKRYPSPITADTSDAEEPDCDLIAADIVPMLMAYRIAINDDTSKAAMYWNMADNCMAQIESVNFASGTMSSFEVTSGWL
ncbi:MAG: hypothetical protein RR009_03505 [Oscillospiraceae bacterium]